MTTSFKLRSVGIAFLVTMFLARSSQAFLRPMRQQWAPRTVRFFSGLDIAPAETVLKVFEKPNAVILDVRSQAEVDEQGFIQTKNQRLWIRENCTPADCPDLAATAASQFPDKSTPVIIHCASGMRANKAKQILNELGYEDVVNAGGYAVLGYLQEAADKL